MDLLEFALDTGNTRDSHPLATLVRAAATQSPPRFAAANRTLDVRVEAHLPWVTASPSAVRQILDALLRNHAFRCVQRGEIPAIRVGRRILIPTSVRVRRMLCLRTDRLQAWPLVPWWMHTCGTSSNS